MKEQKRSSKTIDIVSYASKVSVNSVTCVFVVHFRSSDTFKLCKLAYLVLHKALLQDHCHNIDRKLYHVGKYKRKICKFQIVKTIVSLLQGIQKVVKVHLLLKQNNM